MFVDIRGPRVWKLASQNVHATIYHYIVSFSSFELLGFYCALKCDIIRIIRIRKTMISFVGMIHRDESNNVGG